MKQILLLFSCCLLTISYAIAQTSILGTVRDADTQKPIYGANVMIGNGFGVITDKNGQFSFPKVQEGDYEIRVSFVGYAAFSQKVSVQAKEQVTLNINLKIKSEKMGEVVILSLPKAQSPILNTDQMSVDMIQRNNSVTLDDALDRMSGVSVLGGQVNIRGGSGFSLNSASRTMMLVDGMPLLLPDIGGIKWAFLPLEAMASTQVDRTASKVQNGAGTHGGVISFNTRNIDKTYTEVSLFANLFGEGRPERLNPWDRPQIAKGISIFHQQRVGKLGVAFSLNAVDQQSYRADEYSKRQRAYLKLDYAYNPKWNFNFTFNGMRDSLSIYYIWESGTEPYIPLDSNTYTKDELFFANIDLSGVYKPNTTTEHHLRNRLYFTDNFMVFNEYFIQKKLVVKEKGEHRFVGGLVNNISWLSKSPFVSYNQAIHAALEGNIQRLSYYAGVRGEAYKQWDQANPVIFPVWRGGVNYQVFKSTELRFFGGRGVRTPTLVERNFESVSSVKILPNSSLLPEKGLTAEIGLRHSINKSKFTFIMDAAVFHSSFQNMIELNFGAYVPEVVDSPFVIENYIGFKSLNIFRSKINGFELGGDLTALLGKVKVNLQGGYTFIEPIDLRSNPDTSGGNPYANYLKYRSRHLLRGDLNFTYRNFQVGGNIRYNSFMLNIDNFFYALVPGVTEFRELKPNGDFQLDLRASYKFRDFVRVAYILRNVTNEEIMYLPGNISAPINHTIQLTFTL